MVNRLLVAAITGLGLTFVEPAAAQGLSPATDWVRRGATVDVTPSGLTLRRGVVRSPTLLTNFVIQFDFRALDSETEAALWIRSRRPLPYPDAKRGYRVALASRGSGMLPGMVETNGVTARMVTSGPPPAKVAADGWRSILVSARDEAVVVAIDGQVVLRFDDLNGVTGYVEFEATRGMGVEIRDIKAARVPWSADPFPVEGAIDLKQGEPNRPDVINPRLIRDVKPLSTWPLIGGPSREGAVTIRARLDELGKVRDMVIVESLDTDHDESSLAHARRWEFEPAKRAGVPVPALITIKMSFVRH